VSGEDILEEFQFVNDVRNVTSSGKIKQKEIYDKFKEKVSDKQNNLCNFCGKRIGVLSEFDVEFIVPLSRGGNNNLSNSQALCNSCCESKNSIDKFLQ
jgi:5-methylcytosine-specific restriction endonuclease McrA